MKEQLELLVGQMTRLEQEQAEIEQRAKDIKAAIRQIAEDFLPTVMQEYGLSEATLANGLKVELREEVQASISEDNRAAAHCWLIENGFGGLIKTSVQVEFGRGEVDAAHVLAHELRQDHDSVLVKDVVHPATLKSFIKEQMAAGTNVPLDLFGVFPYSIAKVSNGKRGR